MSSGAALGGEHATDCGYGRRRLDGGGTCAGAERTDGSEDGRYGRVDRFSGPVGGWAGHTALAGAGQRVSSVSRQDRLPLREMES